MPTKQRRERERVPSTYRHVWRPAPRRHESCSTSDLPQLAPAEDTESADFTQRMHHTRHGDPPFYPCVIGAAPGPCALAKLANRQEAAGADDIQPQGSSTRRRPLGRRVSAVPREPHVVNADRHRNASPREVDRGAPRAKSPYATRRRALTATSGVCGPWSGKVCCEHGSLGHSPSPGGQPPAERMIGRMPGTSWWAGGERPDRHRLTSEGSDNSRVAR